MLPASIKSAGLPEKELQGARHVPAGQERHIPVTAFEYQEKINWANNLNFFLCGFSHMFKGPINSILLGSELLHHYVDDINDLFNGLNDEPWRLLAGFPEAGADLLGGGMPTVLKGISDSAQRLDQFISLLSEFTGRGYIATCRDLEIKKLASLCTSMIQHKISEFTNQFSLDIEDDLPVLPGSAQKISRVIQNLIMNALLSLPDRSCAVVLSASCNKATGCVRISVRDEGVGISPEIFAHILEPFFSTWTEHGCMGLGLPVAERIIHAHGGNLSIESQPGSGTTVSVLLPVHGKTDNFAPECDHHA